MHYSLRDILDLAVGGATIAAAILIVMALRSYLRTYIWIAPLALFFCLRGLDRITSAGGVQSRWFEVLVDLLSVGALGFLLVGLRNTVAALDRRSEAAAAASEEYQRALTHYTQLMRHRLANPLTALRGGVETLLELDLDPPTREQVLIAMRDKVEELEHVSLRPEARDHVERELQARPQIPKGLEDEIVRLLTENAGLKRKLRKGRRSDRSPLDRGA